jgi:formate hydrogenlyase subunit 3/multisubunit Na+/H+ antiporter MnhD subunit
VQVLYFKGGKNNPERKEAPVAALIPIVVFMILIIAIGIYPKLITGVLNSAASELLHRMDYIKSVLG